MFKRRFVFWLLFFSLSLTFSFQTMAFDWETLDFDLNGRFGQSRSATMTNWRKTLIPLTMFGGTSLDLKLYLGNQQQPIYAYLPINLNHNKYQLTAASADYFFVLQKDPLLLSLTSRGAYYENQAYAFNSIKDPLGALNHPNTEAPVMTLKFLDTLPSGWNIQGYYLADTRSNFIPRTETIPDAVFSAVGTTKDKMLYYDESPSYTMLRATKPFLGKNSLGVLYGKKEAVNINPREADNEKPIPNLKHGVGYSKENIGLDLTGQLGLFNKPDYTLAIVGSGGEWRNHQKDLDNFWESAGWDSLGKLSGTAYKAGVEGLELGSLTVDGSYHRVDPNFQWIAVRHSRYEYLLGPSEYGAYGHRALYDRDFTRRIANKSKHELSDISTYHALSALQTNIKIPGALALGGEGGSGNEPVLIPPLAIARAYMKKEEIYDYRMLARATDGDGIAKSPVELSVDLAKIDNLNQGETYFDPKSNLKLKDGYSQVRGDLNIGYNMNTKINLFGSARNYNTRNSYYRDLGVAVTSTPIPSLAIVGEAALLQRARPDTQFGEGTLSRGSVSVEGVTLKGVKLGSSLDYRYGNYDMDLTEETEDRVLKEDYSYLGLRNYLEFAPRIKIGSVQTNTIVAGEIRKDLTSLANLNEGTTYIGYLYNYFPINDLFSLKTTGVSISGEQAQQINWYDYDLGQLVGYTAKKHSYLTLALSVKPFGSKQSTFTLSHTTNFTKPDTTTNWLATWQTTIGSNLFYLNYRADWNWVHVMWYMYF